MKRFFTTFIFLILTSLLLGQVVQSVGIKSGVSIANQTWFYKSINLTLKKDKILGSYSALTVDFIKSKYFNIATDIGYCQKGCTEKIQATTVNMPEGTGVYKTYNTKFNYFSFSPLVKTKYTTTHFIPYIILGARIDYQLSYKSDLYLKQFESNFHKTILGLSSGAGMEFKIKNFGINTEFQYQYDITKLVDTPPSAINTGLRINNKAFVISIGLKYHLNKKAEANK